jgi:hypothetical protein
VLLVPRSTRILKNINNKEAGMEDRWKLNGNPGILAVCEGT